MDLEGKIIFSMKNSDVYLSSLFDSSEMKQFLKLGELHTSILAVTQHTALKHNLILTKSNLLR